MTRDVAKWTLDEIGAEEVRWHNVGAERAEDYNFVYSKELN